MKEISPYAADIGQILEDDVGPIGRMVYSLSLARARVGPDWLGLLAFAVLQQFLLHATGQRVHCEIRRVHLQVQVLCVSRSDASVRPFHCRVVGTSPTTERCKSRRIAGS